jgi:hypothetical protein
MSSIYLYIYIYIYTYIIKYIYIYIDSDPDVDGNERMLAASYHGDLIETALKALETLRHHRRAQVAGLSLLGHPGTSNINMSIYIYDRRFSILVSYIYIYIIVLDCS